MTPSRGHRITPPHTPIRCSQITRGATCRKEAERNPWRAVAARIAEVLDAPARGRRAALATPKRTRLAARRAPLKEIKKPPDQGGFSSALVRLQDVARQVLVLHDIG